MGCKDEKYIGTTKNIRKISGFVIRKFAEFVIRSPLSNQKTDYYSVPF
jgi:hypothetical protein